MEKIKIINWDKKIKEIMEERQKFIELGDLKMADGLLTLAVYMEQNKPFVKPIKLDYLASS